MHRLLQDSFRHLNFVVGDGENSNEPISEEPNEEAVKFLKLLKEAEIPLYPGCTKHSKLSFLIRLLHVKCINGWSNKSFDMLLKVLTESLPNDINIQKNHY